MSRFVGLKSCVLAAAVAGGALAYLAHYWISRRKLNDKPPKRWKKVGEVSDLLCYPVKSCSPIRLKEFHCDQNGLKIDNIHDRTFMLVNGDGKFMNATVYPKLVKVVPKVDGNVLILSAPEMSDLVVDVSKLTEETSVKAKLFDQFLDAVDFGDEAAFWFCKFLEQENLRFVFYPSSEPSREVRAVNKGFKKLIRDDSGALQNTTSYMLLNESSVDDLNTRLPSPVTTLHFRPNIVVKGAKTYAEDYWEWVKIGNVVFRNVKLCSRCPVVTVDPESAVKHPQQEPLKTLRAYRNLKEAGGKPVMGIHLGVRQQGKISLRDFVYVEDV